MAVDGQEVLLGAFFLLKRIERCRGCLLQDTRELSGLRQPQSGLRNQVGLDLNPDVTVREQRCDRGQLIDLS